MDSVNKNPENLHKIWYTDENGHESLISYQNYKNILEKSNNSENNINNINNININNNQPNVLDLTEQIKPGMLVMSEWGEGKVISINKTDQTIVLSIEGENHSFNISTVNPLINIFVCVVIKNKTNWLNLKIFFDDNCFNIKSKISKIFKCHINQIILIHNNKKITDNNKSTFNMGLYENGCLLCVIKEKEDSLNLRFKNKKLVNKINKFNFISISVDQKIQLKNLLFYRNLKIDLNYSIIIKDITKINEQKILFLIENIIVPKVNLNDIKNLGFAINEEIENFDFFEKIESFICKFKIEEEFYLEKNNIYEIIQIVNNYSEIDENNKQFFGINAKNGGNFEEEGITFFYNEIENDLDEKINIFKQNNFSQKFKTNINQGLIPGLIFSFQ